MTRLRQLVQPVYDFTAQRRVGSLSVDELCEALAAAELYIWEATNYQPYLDLYRGQFPRIVNGAPSMARHLEEARDAESSCVAWRDHWLGLIYNQEDQARDRQWELARKVA